MNSIDFATPGTWLVLIAVVGPIVLLTLRALRGRLPTVRRLPGMDALEEAVGRAAEMGKPVVFSTGLRGIDVVTLAALSILEHVARLCARLGVRLIVPQISPETYALAEDVVRRAYQAEGKADRFNSDDVIFLSPNQFAYASGYIGILHREKAATNLMFGAFAAESLILAEAGNTIGAAQIAGTTAYHQIPFFISACDYTLIGEELYAASSYIEKDPIKLGSLAGLDWAKSLILVLVLVGVLVGTVASIWSRAGVVKPNDNHVSKSLLTTWRGAWEAMFGAGESDGGRP
ncbi:MAG: DUF6754 domain-containing protein [Planctomycetota bacterium]